MSVGIVSAQSCVLPPSGIASWWTGDVDGSDEVGGTNGVLMNGAQAGVPGEVRGAFSFDGVDDNVYLGHDTWSESEFTQGTISMWVDYSGIPSGNHQFLFELEGRMRLYIGGGTGKWSANLYDGTNRYAYSTNVATSGWHHLATTWDGTTLKVYVNGVLEDSVPAGSPLFNSVSRASRIGSTYNLVAFFNGKIDEPTIYTRALTATEIQSVYDAGSEGKCLPSACGDGIVQPPEECDDGNTQQCVDGTGNRCVECKLVDVSTNQDLCGDGIDNDCNGYVDDLDADNDGQNDCDGSDKCLGSQLPEGVPTKELKPNHFANVDSDNTFEMCLHPKGDHDDEEDGGQCTIVDSQYTMIDSCGCTCEQILDIKPGKNTGEYKDGCTKGTMKNWIRAKKNKPACAWPGQRDDDDEGSRKNIFKKKGKRWQTGDVVASGAINWNRVTQKSGMWIGALAIIAVIAMTLLNERKR